MKTFKQYLVENEYPGGYYYQGKLVVHFNNEDEKKEYDADPRNDPNDEYQFMSDKRAKLGASINSIKYTAGDKLLAPIAKTAAQVALGPVLGQIPVDQISNNINKLREELEKSRNNIMRIEAEIRNTKDENLKAQLKKEQDREKERAKEILAAKNRYEKEHYS